MTDKQQRLNDLGKEYGTDKGQSGHNYLFTYGEYIPDECRSMLEIGVAKGASALMWQQFYGEDLDLHILDLFQDKDHVSTEWCKRRFITPHVGDQSSIEVLSEIKDKFEIIVDDGSHVAHHMILSFKHLFHNNLISGGQYYIEDCQTNLDSFYWGGDVKSFEDTPLYMFKKFIETGELINPYLNSGEQEIFKNLIQEVKILVDDKLILITRK